MATVLVVCTGNVCRSPLAERLLLAGLGTRAGDEHGVTVHSAGTGSLAGEPMTPETAEIARQQGVDPGEHVAKDLRPEHVAAADLVLALTRRHRSAVVGLHPRASRYAFTLRELARLVEIVPAESLPDGDPSARLRALVPAAASRRGFQVLEDPADDDVVDPYRRGPDVYAAMSDQLVPAVGALLDVLAPAR